MTIDDDFIFETFGTAGPNEVRAMCTSINVEGLNGPRKVAAHLVVILANGTAVADWLGILTEAVAAQPGNDELAKLLSVFGGFGDVLKANQRVVPTLKVERGQVM